jgi:hypothetical protein
MKIFVSKIGSVTKNIPLEQEIEITTENIPVTEGTVLAVEVMADQKLYNELELKSGRMSKLSQGDKIVVALGRRRALRGFVGDLPTSLKAGDIIDRLSMSGVSGVCVSANQTEVGKPLPIKILGAVIVDGKIANIKDHQKFPPADTLKKSAPLVLVTGTCMHVGKTTVAAEMIKQGSRAGLKVASAKMTGVAAMRDLEDMRDYGSVEAVSFLDAGLTSSIGNEAVLLSVFKGALNHLNTNHTPDVIIIEFGDGILGEYGVMELIKDPEIQAATAAHIGCAYDPVGAVKLAEIAEEIGLPLTVVSGPITDNGVGQRFVESQTNIPARNAIHNGKELFEVIKNKLKK